MEAEGLEVGWVEAEDRGTGVTWRPIDLEYLHNLVKIHF